METIFLVEYFEEDCCSGWRYKEFKDTAEGQTEMMKFINTISRSDYDACRALKVRKVTVVQEYDLNITLVPKTN